VTTNIKLIETLSDMHFGDHIREYDELLDRIISCKKLEEFLNLNMPFKSPALIEVFERASKERVENNNILPARFEIIFKQIKSVNSNVDFI